MKRDKIHSRRLKKRREMKRYGEKRKVKKRMETIETGRNVEKKRIEENI